MSSISVAPHVKLFAAILYQPTVDLPSVAQMLAEVFGSVQYIGTPIAFDCTNYYEEEMGPGLLRAIIGFTGPHYADILVEAKRACIELEKGCAVSEKRSVNLDVGYLDHHKIVLASTKAAGHKVYLDCGIYADFVARYGGGSYAAMPWGFPDFKEQRYNEDFVKLRALLRDHPG
jgi:hypothetical protein